MSGFLYEVTPRGNVVSPQAAEAVDHLLKKHSMMNKWDFIAELVRVWAKRNPEMWASYTSSSENEKYRGTMKNDFAATKDLGMRKLADIPADLYHLLEFFYPAEVKDRKFMMAFVKEYPMFKVGDKV